MGAVNGCHVTSENINSKIATETTKKGVSMLKE
jgi:hypothetical protein